MKKFELSEKVEINYKKDHKINGLVLGTRLRNGHYEIDVGGEIMYVKPNRLKSKNWSNFNPDK